MCDEKLLVRVGKLEVGSRLTGAYFRLGNASGNMEGLRIGSGVNERSKLHIGPRSEGVWSENFMWCVGTFVMTDYLRAMTHNNLSHANKQGNTVVEIDSINEVASKLGGGTALVWKRRFTGRNEHRKIYTDWFVDQIVEIYKLQGIWGIIAEFPYTENPMSAYYDGAGKLTFTANGIDKSGLFAPNMSKF